MMAETGLQTDHPIWKKFLRKHWQVVVLFVAAAILIPLGGVLVYLWVVSNVQSTGLVPEILVLWSLGDVVTFVLQLILWEILLVGIPTIIAGLAGWLWWRRLPGEERREYHFFGRRSRATSGGGGFFSLLIFIAFCFKVSTDGRWNEPIATWTFNYLVYSWLTALIWILIIFAIPAGLGILWWINHEMKKKP